MHYLPLTDISGDTKRDHRPFFKCHAVLAIPNVVMSPALDEVQQNVNKAAQMIISVSKVSCIISIMSVNNLGNIICQ